MTSAVSGTPPVIAGFDFGTSSVKLAVATADGTVLARARAGYAAGTITGPRGAAEQHPEDWWSAAREALDATGLAGRVDALALTGQMQDLIPVAGGSRGGAGTGSGSGSAARDAGRGPLRPALLYSDTRAIAEHARLRAALPGWEEATGNEQDPSSVAAKIAWLAAHEPETLDAAEHLLLGAPGYIAWRATGVAACDVLTASTTGLMDAAAREWLPEAVEAAGARPGQLPRLVGAGGDDAAFDAGLVGLVGATAAAELGVRAGIPVVHALGDAGAVTDGLVGSEPGDAYLSLGTTGWLAAVTPAPAPGSPAAAPSPVHALVLPGGAARLRIGAVQSAGATAAWARRTYLPGLGSDEAEAAVAARVADPAAIAVRPLCLPGLGGERAPVRDAAFRGAFVGVHEETRPADLYLAALTGVAMALRHVAADLGVALDSPATRIALVGGGAASPAWRRILADVLGVTIVTSEADDPGTHSAVRAAARALGAAAIPRPLFAAPEHPAPDALAETPPSPATGAYAEQIPAHRALYAALAPTFHALAPRA